MEKLIKIQKFSLFIFIFLYIIIGLRWEITALYPVINIKLLGINNIIWYPLIIIQNLLTWYLVIFKKLLYEAIEEYNINILSESDVVVGYSDDVFNIGTKYKIIDYYEIPKPGTFNGRYAGFKEVHNEKIFKFIPLKKYRKIKLNKLSNL